MKQGITPIAECSRIKRALHGNRGFTLDADSRSRYRRISILAQHG